MYIQFKGQNLKKESEFSKTLEDLDKKVAGINRKQDLEEKKLRKVQALKSIKEEETKKKREEEEKTVKKDSIKIKILLYLTCFILGSIITIPLMKKDPDHFWFVVIVLICVPAVIIIKKEFGG